MYGREAATFASLSLPKLAINSGFGAKAGPAALKFPNRSRNNLAAGSPDSVCPAPVVTRDKKMTPKNVLEKPERKTGTPREIVLLRTRKPLDVPPKARVGLNRFLPVV